MKTETRTVYVSFDDKEFGTEAACAAYERLHSGARLVGMTEKDIADAISGENREIGAALEAIAKKVRDARLARGDSKRPRKPKGEGEANPETAPESGDDTQQRAAA
jgi:hypothetical protein